jgi:hypothetical protein
MVRVALAEEATAPRSGFEEHAITTRIRGPIRNTVLDDVDIDSASKRLVESFPPRPIDYFLDGEVSSLGMFAMQQCARNPDFVRDFELGLNR